MKAYRIKDIKGFMAHILTKDTFDAFLLAEAKISGKAMFTVHGTPAAGFFSDEESFDESGYVSYGLLRDVCLSMVKGSRTPELLQMMLLLPRDRLISFVEGTDSTLQPNDVENLSVLIRFKDGELVVTTGSALRIFTMDKALDGAWERYVEEFLTERGLDWELL